jgi:hypothetical protein
VTLLKQKKSSDTAQAATPPQKEAVKHKRKEQVKRKQPIF